jgi:hypothetical protein
VARSFQRIEIFSGGTSPATSVNIFFEEFFQGSFVTRIEAMIRKNRMIIPNRWFLVIDIGQN